MTAEHRLATVPGGHPVIPLPVHWRMGAHGDVSVPGVGTVPITEAEATMSAAVAKVERWCEQRGATLIHGAELTAIVEPAGEATT